MNQNNTGRGKYILWTFLPVIIALFLELAIELIFSQVAAVYSIITFKGETLGEFYDYIIDIVLNENFAILIMLIFALCNILIFGNLYKKMFKKEEKYKFLKTSSNKTITICGLIILIIGLQYISYYISASLGSAFPSWLEKYNQMVEQTGFSNGIGLLSVLYVVFLGPIGEELIFRGVVYHSAKQVFPPYAAIVIQAILFGFFHTNMLQASFTFVMALASGYIMYLYDDIVLAILLHMGFNFAGSILVGLLPIGGDTVITFFLWLLGSLIVSYFGILLLKKGAAKVNTEHFSADI